MKITMLQLLAFGPFTERTLDLSNDDTGLHLIYGPNEAGKSSALRAIDALLFQFPYKGSNAWKASPPDFLHRDSQLRIGGTLRNSAGEELSFVRRKGLKKSLVMPDESATPLPDDALDSFLKGMEPETFRRLYCIDHDEFRAGGDRMRNLNGLLGESLFAASLGGAGLADVQESLNAEAKELFGKRSSTIKTGIAAYQAAKREKSDLEVSGRLWKTLKDSYDAKESNKKEVVQCQLELDIQKRKLQQLRDALPRIAQWLQLKEQLAGEEALILPGEYSVEERSKCEATLNETKKQIERLRRKLCETDERLQEINETPELINNADIIEGLHQRVASQLQALERLTTSEINLTASRERVQTQLLEVGSDVEVSQAGSLAIRREHKAAILDLARNETRHQEAKQELSDRKSELEYELKTVDQSLQSMGASSDASQLQVELQYVLSNRAIELDIDNRKVALQRAQQQAQVALAELPHWGKSLEELTIAKVPLRETIDSYNDRFAELSRQLETRQEHLEEVERQLEEARENISSQRASAVLTEADLEQARRRRDHGWHLVKDEWQNGIEDAAALKEFAGSASLADAFAVSVKTADTIVDRLRREADRVAVLTQKQQRAIRLEKSIEKAQKQVQQLQTEQLELGTEWQQQWTLCGVTNPRSPREMAGWLERRSALSQIATEIRNQAEVIENLDRTRLACHDRLLGALKSVDTKRAAGCESLAQLCVVAEQVLESCRQRETERERLANDQKRLRQSLAKTKNDLEAAMNRLDTWRESWARAMDLIGCDATTTAAQASERIQCMDDLSDYFQGWTQLCGTVEATKIEIARFQEDMAAVVVRIAPDLQELPPIDAAKELKARLDESRRDQQSATHLRTLQSDQQAELDSHERIAEELELQLAQFCSWAGVESREGLVKVEGLSRSAQQLQHVQQELLLMSAGVSLEEFIAQAEGADAADLDARISQLETEIAEQVLKRDRIVTNLTEILSDMEKIDGNDAAARADQRAMSHLARVHEDAGRYLLLRIGASILQQQVERYREDNQDPLLAKASEFFARMTCYEFNGIRSKYDDNGKPIIIGVRRNNDEVVVEGMSDGTLDPLFLSLRLAYLQRRLSQHEPMPFVVDDILIHLDDERALATLQLLADLSKETQVLFFTHHHRLRELAEANLPPAVLTVHRLERRN